MSKDRSLTIALIGNPNSGKTSLFNQLTGLHQKIGNFPGVTVDKKTGMMPVTGHPAAKIIDLPGTYSLYAKSKDEDVVTDVLINPAVKDSPDLLVVIVDVSNLKRNLLLFTQVKDLGYPTILVLNMGDLATRMGKGVDLQMLEKELGVQVLTINARTGDGISALKNTLLRSQTTNHQEFLDIREIVGEKVREQMNGHHLIRPYLALHSLLRRNAIDKDTAQSLEARETTLRYRKISKLVTDVEHNQPQKGLKIYTDRIDKILTHQIFGYIIFLGILFTIFQSIFAWATVPMNFIDHWIAQTSGWLGLVLPPGVFTDLLKDGIVPGVGGVVIFIPQIAILFAFIAILEESGYMARVVFLMDKIMRGVGLSGRSVVPLISGVACAIPAIMATRNIEHWKERLITIFVTPLISCSARLPVYTILIALVIPQRELLGIINLQGLVLLSLYLVGFFAAIGSAYLLKRIMHSSERSFLIMELPTYKMPRWKNVGIVILEKVKAFSFTAGKIIIAISIVLWVLSSYGPGEKIKHAEEYVRTTTSTLDLSKKEIDDRISSYKLEHSYAATLGHIIEPVIAPLGFNWKIGIALVTSFAAREVFVGTMATLYSIESSADNTTTIMSRMKDEKNPRTGKSFYTIPMGLSLMIFYAFAMQCMSTLAVVHRETKSWKWPFLQTIYMSGLAYLASFLVFRLFS